MDSHPPRSADSAHVRRGMLVVIEGLDGAGKRTLTEGLRRGLESAGASVATLAFPRYGQSVTADLAHEALHGGHGDLASSVYAMAVLFALDRAGAKAHLADLRGQHDVVILDRYVASNAAYCAARLFQDADAAMVSWVGDLEFGRLGLPRPDRQILLGVPVELAAQRASLRESGDSDRARDAYERDTGLQQRTAAVYSGLAARSWYGPWTVVGFQGGDVAVESLVSDLLG